MILRLLLAAGLLLGLAAATLYCALSPPAPLSVPERGAVLAGVTIVNPGSGRSANRTLRVEGERIADIEPADGDAASASEFAGAFVLPGLIDMHAHYPPPTGLGQTEHFALLFLRHGVTTVRDAGDIDGLSSAPARDGVAEGRFPGPRSFACGPFVDGPATIWPNTVVVAEPAEAAPAVAGIADAGFDCVKVYNDLTPASLHAVRAAAKQRGLPVIGHVPRRMRFEEARLDDVQHMIGIAVPDEMPSQEFPENMRLWTELSEERIQTVITAALTHDIAVTPTLVVMDRHGSLDRPDRLQAAADAQLVPRFYRAAVWRTNPDWRAEHFDWFRAALPAEQRLARRLHEAGGRVHVGTDTLTAFVVPGAGLHRELALFVDAGFSPEEALMLATAGNGADLALAELGRVAPGAPADLLVLREDPTRDLAALSTLEAIVADGRLYRVDEIEAQLARARRYHEGRLFDAISVAVTERVLADLERD